MTANRSIRRATVHDAAAAAALIADWFPELIAVPQQAAHFINSVSKDAEAGYICAPNFDYLLGFEDGQLAAIGALRDNGHLYHLFVARPYTRRGWARSMWHALQEIAQAHGNPGAYSVNASSYGLAAYQRLGFVVAAPQEAVHGIQFTPMRWHSRAYDLAQVDSLCARFYAAFDNRAGRGMPDPAALAALFTDDARIICSSAALPNSMRVADFHEAETWHQTTLFGSSASRISHYQKHGWYDDAPYDGAGHKHFHLLRQGADWKIAHLLWEDERPGLHLPAPARLK